MYHLELTFVTPSFAIRNFEREHFQAEIEKVVCRGRKTALAEGNKLPQADKKTRSGHNSSFRFLSHISLGYTYLSVLQVFT